MNEMTKVKLELELDTRLVDQLNKVNDNEKFNFPNLSQLVTFLLIRERVITSSMMDYIQMNMDKKVSDDLVEYFEWHFNSGITLEKALKEALINDNLDRFFRAYTR